MIDRPDIAPSDPARTDQWVPLSVLEAQVASTPAATSRDAVADPATGARARRRMPAAAALVAVTGAVGLTVLGGGPGDAVPASRSDGERIRVLADDAAERAARGGGRRRP